MTLVKKNICPAAGIEPPRHRGQHNNIISGSITSWSSTEDGSDEALAAQEAHHHVGRAPRAQRARRRQQRAAAPAAAAAGRLRHLEGMYQTVIYNSKLNS